MAGRNRSIQQIRFVNGTEVIANILVWDEDIIEVNNALMMEPLHGEPEDTRAYYVLKPLVSYTDDLGKAVTINPGSIMCVSEPSSIVMDQYSASVAEITGQLDDDPVRDDKSNIVSFDSRKRILTED